MIGAPAPQAPPPFLSASPVTPLYFHKQILVKRTFQARSSFSGKSPLTPSQSVYEGKCKARHGPLFSLHLHLFKLCIAHIGPTCRNRWKWQEVSLLSSRRRNAERSLRFPNARCQLCVVVLPLCQAYYKVGAIYIKSPNGLICVGFHHQRVPQFRVFRRKSMKCLSFYLSAI